MAPVISSRLDDQEPAGPDRLVQASEGSASELVGAELRRQALRETLRLLHDELAPQARSAGWLAEDDILRDVS